MEPKKGEGGIAQAYRSRLMSANARAAHSPRFDCYRVNIHIIQLPPPHPPPITLFYFIFYYSKTAAAILQPQSTMVTHATMGGIGGEGVGGGGGGGVAARTEWSQFSIETLRFLSIVDELSQLVLSIPLHKNPASTDFVCFSSRHCAGTPANLSGNHQ